MNFESMSKNDYRAYIIDTTGINRINAEAFANLYDNRERATPQFMKGLGDFVHHANRNTIIDMDVQLAFDKLRHLLI